MQRIRVDLPDPDGPAMTIRSPLCTVRSMSRRTWNVPYHLFMLRMSMATSSLTGHLAAVDAAFDVFHNQGPYLWSRCRRRSRYIEYRDMPKQMRKKMAPTKMNGSQ